MFLKKHDRFKDGKNHTYWSLRETIRTPDGPRQRTLCYLGELNNSQEKRWRKTVKVFNQEGEEEQLSLFPADRAPEEDDKDVTKIDLKTVRLERCREFGAVYLAWQMWKKLGLDKFWEEKIDPQEEEHQGRFPDIE